MTINLTIRFSLIFESKSSNGSLIMDLNQGMFYFNAGKNMSKKSNFKLSSYFIVAKKVDNGFLQLQTTRFYILLLYLH